MRPGSPPGSLTRSRHVSSVDDTIVEARTLVEDRTVMFIPRTLSLSLSIFLLGLTACGGGDATEELAAVPDAPREVRFVSTDFAFEGPGTIESGLVTFVLDNRGETLHHLQLVKLPDGMSMEDFQEAMSGMQPGSPPPPWFHDAGGVNPPDPENPARVTMLVEPGEYAVLCLVDTPDRIPHVMKGMMQPLTVTESSEPAGLLPDAELTLTLVDYAFSFAEPPVAGRYTIRVENAAEQAHEVAFFRFLPGKTMDDLAAWAESYAEPAPFVAAGGVPGIHPGQAVNVHVDFTPGDYVALCFVPDATDGQLHLAHGMALPFTVS